MKTPTFHIVDVFAEEKYAGNQLAVFRDTAALSDDAMQRIAREMNFSETTFITAETPRDGGYDVRIFTPAAEVPFAGHPTLGTAFIIRQEIVQTPVERVTLNLKVGPIPVTFGRGDDRDLLWMTQPEPQFGPAVDPATIAAVVGLDADDLDPRFAPQAVSTGLWFTVVPLRTLDAVRRARIARDAYAAFIRSHPGKAILVFCPETTDPQNALHVRVFVPCYGVEEDPATGSGNGCLAAYLVQHRYFGTRDIDIAVEQGEEIGRPARLYLRAADQDGTLGVRVGGKVVPVARGQLI